jgi:hypothetical protein
MKTKICSKCKIEKTISEFYRDTNKKAGIKPYCKVCSNLYTSIWKSKNKEKTKDTKKKTYEKNRDYYKKKSNEYYYLNKEKIRERLQNNKQERYARLKFYRYSNSGVRIQRSISSALSKMINKTQTTSMYLNKFGYSIEELKSHLENKFKEGMSFDNYGEWHIDHITPKSWFNCENEDELINCWSLENLQPLWAEENCSKGNRYKG